MPGLRDALHDRGLLARVTLPPDITALLDGLQPSTPVGPGDDVRGTASLVITAPALGFLSLTLTPPAPAMPFHLVCDRGAGTFQLWLVLNEAAPAQALFGFAAGATGTVLRSAEVRTAGRQQWLEPVPGAPRLTGAGIALLVAGASGSTATLRVVPGDGTTGGLVTLGLDPATVLMGDTGFGFELAQGLTIDESRDEAAPGTTVLAGVPVQMAADAPAWRGLLARSARFFVPRGVGLLGGHPVEAYVAVGTDPLGVDVAFSTRWTPDDGGPAVDVRLECFDPGARGLQDFVPTLVEAAVTLPLQEQQVGGAALTVAAGRPVVARMRFARSSTDPMTRVTLGVESQGPDGILSVRAPQGGTPAKAAIAAGALATAIVADDPPSGSDATGAGLHALLAVALGLSTLLKDSGRLTVNAVELESAGAGLPVGGAVRLEVDYSVDVLVKPISVGVLTVTMRDEQPMRVRNRHVLVTYDPARDGLDRFRLDFSQADMEIEDPGSWRVDGPASLFDILGTRSGRGSMWLEVDLRFKVSLGPVRVSGATIRATRENDGSVSASLRGLDAAIDVPGVLRGSGGFQLEAGGGFAAELDVAVVPLNLAAGATLLYRPADGSFFLQLGVDLPGPIPVANTGIGLYGVAGSFGYGLRPARPPAQHPDPVGFQLAWDSTRSESWDSSRGNVSVGAELVIGTLPDLGFTFSTKGGVFLTVPDLAVRGALWGQLFASRMSVRDRPTEGAEGFSFRGVVVVDSQDGVTIGLEGRLLVPVLLDARVPLGAHFPSADGSHWFINLGADGYLNPNRVDGRAAGPMRAVVLPDLMPSQADAYVMMQGSGLDKWPRGEPGALTIADGFVLAFGFGFGYTLGVKGLVWAEVHARLDVLLATRPLTLAGFGNVGGSLNLGPFSIGVEADLKFLVAENADPYVHARLCGRIDLFFTEIEGCVEISINSTPTQAVPPPDVHPLDDIQNGVRVGDQAYLIDDRYRRLAPLSTTAAEAEAADRHVWPDTLLHLAFGRPPRLAPGFSGGQFSSVESYPSGLAAQQVGSSMLSYDWDLAHLSLSDVTDDAGGAGTLVAGPLSAAWQLGKDGDPGVRPQAGDLVLLTYQGDLWLDRLADAGEGLPGDPVGAAGRWCEDEPDLGPTWAVGWGAHGAGGLMALPPDPIHPDPRLSPWDATMLLAWSGHVDEPLSTMTGDRLPPGYRYTPPSLSVVEPGLGLEREFDGLLELGGVSGPQAQMAASTALVRPSEPVSDPRMWVAFERIDEGEQRGVTLWVGDDNGRQWEVTDEVELPDGRLALRLAPDVPDPVSQVSIAWRLGKRLGLFGLGGVGGTATGARASRNAARAGLAGVQQQAAQTQPQPPGTTSGQGARCVLEPGRLYRLDLGMTWSGRLFEQDESGKRTEVSSALDQTTYRPGGGADTSTSRSYFFRTTDKPTAGGLVPVQGSTGHLGFLYQLQSAFEPEMLQRHLAGYTPAQSESFRFCDDPLQAHFKVSHVATLAAAYGYELRLAVRRVDVPGTEGETQFPLSSLVAMASLGLLPLADRRRAEAALLSPCAMPTPGATLQALTPLAPLAWYELYVDVPASDGGIRDGRLPGTTFRTSRWRSPTDMLAGLGFAGGTPAAASGDLEVRLPTGPPVAAPDSDGAFQEALARIGLNDWPVTEQPRRSLLWTSAGAGRWALLGLLLESPEPVARPGRCDVQRLSGLGVELRLVRCDRTRSRLLFLAPTPVVPPGPGALTLELVERPSGVVRSGSVAVPATPTFAGES